jgi:hypothetical protein
MVDWMRFSSDTIVAFAKMQADLLHELTPGIPVTHNFRALSRNYDHFDVAECSILSASTARPRSRRVRRRTPVAGHAAVPEESKGFGRLAGIPDFGSWNRRRRM